MLRGAKRPKELFLAGVTHMFSPDELFALFRCESVLPGLFSGEAEQVCPHCGTDQTISVDDPLGSGNYFCCNCQGRFEVDWGAETICWQELDCGRHQPHRGRRQNHPLPGGSELADQQRR